MSEANRSKGRILAIDYGSVRVGLALTDPMRVIAQGAGTVPNDDMLLQTLCDIIDGQDVALVLVGMPYAADGGKGAKAQEVEAFIQRLHSQTPVPVETWDESYSSVSAHRVFRETGMKRKQRQEKGRVDEMAARLFLQEYLEYHP